MTESETEKALRAGDEVWVRGQLLEQRDEEARVYLKVSVCNKQVIFPTRENVRAANPEKGLTGYDLAAASKAMRGTLWLHGDAGQPLTNPTFHDWEAMAKALAAQAAPLTGAKDCCLACGGTGKANAQAGEAPPVRPVTTVKCGNCETTQTLSCWRCGHSLAGSGAAPAEPKRKLSMMLDQLVHDAIAIEGQYDEEQRAAEMGE